MSIYTSQATNSIIGSYIKNKLNKPIINNFYGSFLSTTSQTCDINPIAITYTEKTIGNIDLSGSSIIVAPISGVYKVLFSAQCYVTSGKHYLKYGLLLMM